MAKQQSLEDILAALSALRRTPVTAETVAALRQALQSQRCHVVAKAAQVAGELDLRELGTNLRDAFPRFCVKPVKSDPRCTAKTELARALYNLGDNAASIFLSGVHYRQLEPGFGTKIDTAVDLRVACAHGLIRIGHHGALLEIAELLADPENAARRGAAQALAYGENPEAVPLLRLKVLVGDEDDEVMAECFAALLQIAPTSEVAFVARFLEGNSQWRATAALALGGSRSADALPVLRGWWERTADLDLRRTALTAVAMLRSDAAHGFLFDLVATADGPDARNAIAALGMFHHDPALKARVSAAVEARDDLSLRRAFSAAFP